MFGLNLALPASGWPFSLHAGPSCFMLVLLAVPSGFRLVLSLALIPRPFPNFSVRSGFGKGLGLGKGFGAARSTSPKG